MLAAPINISSLVSGGTNAITAPAPLYAQSFYKETKDFKPLVEHKKVMMQLYAKYKQIIDQAARLCNVPMSLILSTFFIENAKGNPNLVTSAGATGLMMVTPATADTIVIKEKQKGRLTAAEAAIISRVMGSRGKTLLAAKGLTKTVYTTTQNLKNPELNMLLGVMYLGQLIDEHTEGNVLRFDKVFLRYNQGYFTKLPAGNPDQILAFAQRRSKEAGSWLLKALGQNGLMHCWVA